MRILSTVGKAYYGQPNSVEGMYIMLTIAPQKLGHQVDHFDHARLCHEIGPAGCGERFAATVRQGGYDLVLYQAGGRDCMPRDVLADAKKYAPIVVWNSDDDWQWESYSRHLAPFVTYMVTTYPHVFEQNRAKFPNLLLSQWGAFDLYSDPSRKKDIDFSFAGQIYRNRVLELRHLRRKAGLKVHGVGSIRVWCPPFNHRGFRESMAKVFPVLKRPLRLDQVFDIWNRTKVSFTPMSAAGDPNVLQIKARAFEMGLSRTLMLCQPSPNLERYYEPGKEFVPFYDLKDCIAKSKYYIAHESERAKIADAYYKRTRGEHMWEHRWEQIFKDIGIGSASRAKVA